MEQGASNRVVHGPAGDHARERRFGVWERASAGNTIHERLHMYNLLRRPAGHRDLRVEMWTSLLRRLLPAIPRHEDQR